MFLGATGSDTPRAVLIVSLPVHPLQVCIELLLVCIDLHPVLVVLLSKRLDRSLNIFHTIDLSFDLSGESRTVDAGVDLIKISEQGTDVADAVPLGYDLLLLRLGYGVLPLISIDVLLPRPVSDGFLERI